MKQSHTTTSNKSHKHCCKKKVLPKKAKAQGLSFFDSIIRGMKAADKWLGKKFFKKGK